MSRLQALRPFTNCHWTNRHWTFTEKMAAKFDGSRMDDRDYKSICQDFFNEFRRYMYPLEVKTHLRQLRQHKEEQRQAADRRRKTVKRRHILAIIYGRHPLHLPRMKFRS